MYDSKGRIETEATLKMKEKIIAVIQAGGKGTRVDKLTHCVIPKPMLEMNGKPMILWQIEAVKRYGIEEIYIIIGHLGEAIRGYFCDGSDFGVSISYIEEEEPLGSAGSLYYLKEFCHNSTILFLFADVMFDIDINRFLSFHDSRNALVSLLAHPNDHPYDSDLIICDDDNVVVGFDYKGDERNYWYDNLVNSGIYAFSSEILKELISPSKMDLEKDFISKFIPSGRVYMYKSSEYVKDAGTVERFLKVQSDQANGKCEKLNLSRKQKCIFLDRDGTINKYRGLLFDINQFELEDNTIEAIKLINSSEYLAIIVTNQPVVARGLCSLQDVQTIHKKMSTLLGREGAYLDDVVFCPHHPDKGFDGENIEYKVECDCRKPNIGMISSMENKYNINLADSFMIGDTTSDIMTGINAGLRTVLLKTGEAGRDNKYSVTPDIIAEDILSAVAYILNIS